MLPARSNAPHLSTTPLNALIDSPLVLLLSVLVLALAGLAVASFRRRERDQRKLMQALDESDQQLRLALWASGELFWQYDLRSHHLQRTRIVADADNDLAVRSDLDRDTQIHPDDLPRVLDQLRAYLRGDAPMVQIDLRFRGEGDGERWHWLRAHGRTVERDADGRAIKVAGTARDIDAMRELEGQHGISVEVMRNMAEAVAVLDPEFNFLAVNTAFTRMSGYAGDEVIGKNASLLNGNQHEPEFHAAARDSIRTRDTWSGEMWQRRKDGVDFLCAMQCTAILDPGTRQRRYVIVSSDITERRRLEHELRFLANFDPLTNLPNRTHLAGRLARAIMQARASGTKVGLLFLDLDNFTDVNDSLGHPIGDRVLKAAAQRLQDAVGSERTVARVGGDEFTVVIEHITTADEAGACAQAIIDIFDAPLRLDDRYEFTISPSIGIGLFPDHAQLPDDLIKHADTAMYRAKAAGKHGYVHYTEDMDDEIRLRANLIAALRRVLERGELRIEYQPQLALDTGDIGAVEALLRWYSPEYGEVPPSRFIPLAEESGLIEAIGEWVLHEACRTLADWRRAGVGDALVMSVNVSAMQLLRGDLIGSVHRALEASGLPPAALELELTESVLMSNAEVASERLQDFQRMGVSIAVDDFGTGYSSLAYLHRLPINTLKIDKAFVDGLASNNEADSEDTTITTTIIAMARTLGLLVVAEGVETAAQLAFLKQHDCNLVQGYWISPPLRADACLQLLLGKRGLTSAPSGTLDRDATPA